MKNLQKPLQSMGFYIPPSKFDQTPYIASSSKKMFVENTQNAKPEKAKKPHLIKMSFDENILSV
jgi:hypothetical protein